MRFISIHFPKAAGSSLSSQLRTHFDSGLLLDYDHDPLGSSGLEIQDVLPEHIRIVHGHFRALRYDKIRNAFRFTFLRHPVENFVSIYYFWLRLPMHGNLHHDKFLQEKPGIETFAIYGPLRRLLSESYFGGFDMRRLDFIGFFEHRERDLSHLAQILGVNLDATSHINKTAYSEDRSDFMADTHKVMRLRDILADDVRFYEQQLALCPFAVNT